MKCLRLVSRLLAASVAMPVLLLAQAGPGSTPSRGGGQPPRGPAPEIAPCFRTEVPAHPYDLILGLPTEHSVRLSVLAYAAGEAYLEWGLTPDRYEARTPSVSLPAGRPVTLAMEPLLSDTGYVYRLCFRPGTGDFTPSDGYRFHTPRASSRSYTFTLTADSHLDERTDPALYRTTLANALADGPDFHVDLGDTFMGDKMRPLGLPLAGMYLAQRYYLGLLCHSAPLAFVLGNHDGEGSGQDGEALALRQLYFPPAAAPDGTSSGHYYAWRWGDALFVVLDPYTCTTRRLRTAEEGWSRTLGDTQYHWLEKTLAGSRAALKFVFIHHLVGGHDRNGRGGAEAAPYFEWGGNNLAGGDEFAIRRPGWAQPLHQLLVKHGVTAVFHGHDHLYAQQELEGIIYQAVPQPGWVGGERVTEAASYGYASGQIRPSSGHLRVSITGRQATVAYVRAYLPAQETTQRQNAAVAHRYTLPAPH